MKIRNIYLCIHYRKALNLQTGSYHIEIQPGDAEISYLAGNARYAFIGFNADDFDDYGELCFATDDREMAKRFMKENGLSFDGKLNMYSELLDFHENFETDDVGQWKMFSLDGKFEIHES